MFSDLALNKQATQVSVGHRGAASRAVDGNNRTDWGSGSCMHTDYANNPWWRVNLGESLPVATVVIFNRNCPSAHGCADYMRRFEIRIGKPILVLLIILTKDRKRDNTQEISTATRTHHSGLERCIYVVKSSLK